MNNLFKNALKFLPVYFFVLVFFSSAFTVFAVDCLAYFTADNNRNRSKFECDILNIQNKPLANVCGTSLCGPDQVCRFDCGIPLIPWLPEKATCVDSPQTGEKACGGASTSPACALNTQSCAADTECCSGECHNNSCRDPQPAHHQCQVLNQCASSGISGNPDCASNERCQEMPDGFRRCVEDSNCVTCSPQGICGGLAGCPKDQICGSNALNEIACRDPNGPGESCPICNSLGCGYDAGCKVYEDCTYTGASTYECVTAPPTSQCYGATAPNFDECSTPTSLCGQSPECQDNQRCMNIGGHNRCVTPGTSCAQCTNSSHCTAPEECVTQSGVKKCVDITQIGNITYTGPIVTADQVFQLIYAIMMPVGVIFSMFFIIKAGYTLKTSEGNPQKVKEGQEELTAAILGTMFILLSIVILRVIIKSIIGVPNPPF